MSTATETAAAAAVSAKEAATAATAAIKEAMSSAISSAISSAMSVSVASQRHSSAGHNTYSRGSPDRQEALPASGGARSGDSPRVRSCVQSGEVGRRRPSSAGAELEIYGYGGDRQRCGGDVGGVLVVGAKEGGDGGHETRATLCSITATRNVYSIKVSS